MSVEKYAGTKAQCSSIRLRTLFLSSASSASASKLLLERGLSKLKAGRAKNTPKTVQLHTVSAPIQHHSSLERHRHNYTFSEHKMSKNNHSEQATNCKN